MYTKRIQIINYGPISQLDIELPFEGDVPKPVVLVGENGSGKSILLSHIVNGLLIAKDRAYPETPEVEPGKVFKIRHDSYIRERSEFFFSRIDFEDGFFVSELRSRRPKEEHSAMPTGLSGGDAQQVWDRIEAASNDGFNSNIHLQTPIKIREIFSKNCVLYFPSNRFEEPAWLNEETLRAQAAYTGLRHFVGHTNRRLINYTPLRDNQNWLFDVMYDRMVFDPQFVNVSIDPVNGEPPLTLPAIKEYSGNATTVSDIVTEILRRAIRGGQGTQFVVGTRRNRAISLQRGGRTIAPNIFQLSSGETSLLNLFLSILRDFDLSFAAFSSADEVRGIVVVDEIDLHLHAVHQYEILPSLMRMFPKVQFIVTTHSPLFVLGMAQTFGEDGFALYRMPQGQQISPEEFSEFASAYQAFTTTSRFSDDIRRAVLNAQTPILYVEGTTDVNYIRKAAELLGKVELLEGIEIQDGGGNNLKNIWSAIRNLSEDLAPRKVIILHDCDYRGEAADSGNRFRRKIPKQTGHPIEKGIENLFSETTLEKARTYSRLFVNVAPGGPGIQDGEESLVPEKWAVNESQKTNLCNWLCTNGSAEDFQHFKVIFDMLEEVLDVSTIR